MAERCIFFPIPQRREISCGLFFKLPAFPLFCCVKCAFRFLRGAGLCHLLLSGACLLAQPDSLRPYGEGTGYMRPLQEGWRFADGSLARPPFTRFQQAPYELRRALEDDACLPDTFYLCFQGVAWAAELELNNLYLGSHKDPFSPWIIAVQRDWLRPGANELRLRLRGGDPLPDYPRQFTGLFRPAYVAGSAALFRLQAPAMLPADDADTLALLAPYFGRSGHIYNEYEALRRLLPLLRQGVKALCFLYPPPAELRQLCARLGFRELASPPPGAQVCQPYGYPYEPSAALRAGPFWLDADGRRTQHYGTFQAWPHRSGGTAEQARYGLSLLILLPLLCLFLVKLLNASFFYGMFAGLSKPSMLAASLQESASASPNLLFLFGLLRVLSQAALLTLALHYIAAGRLWDEVQLIRRPSLLYEQFYGQEQPQVWRWFVQVLLILLGWSALKYLLLSAGSRVFRNKGLIPAVLSLETVSAFPLLWALMVPVAFLQFAGEGWQPVLQLLSLALGGIYWARIGYISWVGLERTLSFSSGGKILYICALNVLPVIIWL